MKCADGLFEHGCNLLYYDVSCQEWDDGVGHHGSEQVAKLGGDWVQRIVIDVDHALSQKVEVANFELLNMRHFFIERQSACINCLCSHFWLRKGRLIVLRQNPEKSTKIKAFSILELFLLDATSHKCFFDNF